MHIQRCSVSAFQRLPDSTRAVLPHAPQIGSQVQAGKGVPQGKRTKAEKMGVRVLTEEEFFEEVEQRLQDSIYRSPAPKP
jgi:hypothetical protein